MTKKQQEKIKKLKEGIGLIKCKYRLKLSPLEDEISKLKEELKCVKKILTQGKDKHGYPLGNFHKAIKKLSQSKRKTKEVK